MPPKKTPRERPFLDPASESVRTYWINSVRTYHEKASGVESVYDSNYMWDGGVNPKTGRKHGKPIWPTIVEKAFERDLDPAYLIDTLFAGWSGDTAPLPRMVLSDENLARAKKRRIQNKSAIAFSIRTEEALLRTALWSAGMTIADPRAAMSFVLTDRGNGLSALFRYAVAVLKGFPEIADRWETAARIQYTADPESYSTLWSQLLPVDIFKNHALAD